MAYACGRPDLARRFFRRSMGLSLLDTTSSTVNLCFAAMYGEPELWEQAMRLSAGDLKKRKGKAFQVHAMVFIGVMERNADAVSKALATMGATPPISYWGYARSGIVNICHHGLCAFVREHLPSDLFAQVEIPEARGWWPELFEATFTWQGGEPTLAGLLFYEKAVALQRRRANGRRYENSFQTNGLLVDDAWAAFFAENDFLVGLSLDGPSAIHDAHRRAACGGGSHGAVMKALGALQKHGVRHNTLSCVTAGSRGTGGEVYRFLRDAGVEYMQFTPVVERLPGAREK